MRHRILLLPSLALAILLLAPSAIGADGWPSTTSNNATCDIAVTPAATLLLPYFEVDLHSPVTEAVTTIFTVVNTSQVPQVAHITIWTDWAYPVLAFNLFLPGYDVQGINLRDVLHDGVLPPLASPVSLGRAINHPHFLYGEAAARTCLSEPRQIPTNILSALQQALTLGDASGIDPACVASVGGTHQNAQGYVTIDVTNRCSQTVPTSEHYYTDELIYENVLMGDYQYIDPERGTAGGESMVHIRAIPEGGRAGSDSNSVTGGDRYTNLPFTFYDRYVPKELPGIDRRQPLPGVFGVRYISRAFGVSDTFNSELRVWTETATGSNDETDQCGDAILNAAIPFTQVVRFDESENPTLLVPDCRILCVPMPDPSFPAASGLEIRDDGRGILPPDTSATNHQGGWLYFNLNHGVSWPAFGSSRRPTGASQSWVTVQMTSDGRFSAAFPAAPMGNGCSSVPVWGVRPGPIGGVCRSGDPSCNVTD